jgi:hypothetical protein
LAHHVKLDAVHKNIDAAHKLCIEGARAICSLNDFRVLLIRLLGKNENLVENKP